MSSISSASSSTATLKLPRGRARRARDGRAGGPACRRRYARRGPARAVPATRPCRRRRSRSARAALRVEPRQLAADLQGQFAGRRDHQRQRLRGCGQAAVLAEQVRRHGEAEGDGLAGAGLGRDQQVAALGLGFEHGGLDRGGLGIAARGERLGEETRQIFKGHIAYRWGLSGRGASQRIARPAWKPLFGRIRLPGLASSPSAHGATLRHITAMIGRIGWRRRSLVPVFNPERLGRLPWDRPIFFDGFLLHCSRNRDSGAPCSTSTRSACGLAAA